MLCNLKNKIANAKKNLSPEEQKASAKAGEVGENVLKKQNSIIDFVMKLLKSKAVSQTEVHTNSSANVQIHNSNKKESDNHNMQDAKKDIKWDPMNHLKVKYTNVKKLRPASYSTSQNYPKKIGHITEKNDFESLNLETGEKWSVHRSGYYEKIDANGSYEQKIPGTAFYYTFGDTQISIEGNVDRVYMQNYFSYILKEKTEQIDKDHFLINNSNWDIKTLKNHTEQIGQNMKINVGQNINISSGANIVIEAAGNITIKAGGVITLQGAKINLN